MNYVIFAITAITKSEEREDRPKKTLKKRKKNEKKNNDARTKLKRNGDYSTRRQKEGKRTQPALDRTRTCAGKAQEISSLSP